MIEHGDDPKELGLVLDDKQPLSEDLSPDEKKFSASSYDDDEATILSKPVPAAQ